MKTTTDPQVGLEQAVQIFERARELAGDARRAYLDEACVGNGALRADILSMLDAAAAQGDFFSDPTRAVSRPLSEGPGTVIGHYKLLQLIGEGGFGAVYMAEQREPIRRRVALKIIKLGMDTRQTLARFEAERQALAMMDHPNIARVLDAGATASGRPYFVMELVKGVPITEYCDTENLSLRRRLELFVDVCGAVQHAHQKGIIHRDIKPSNVLVTIADGKPIPKVIDFGIAKAMNRELTDKTLFTEYRQLIGTPQYMTPEQAEMSGVDIDTRSDIYTLGVLLYELVTGTTPFDAVALRKAGYAEIQRIIREQDPPKPSTRLSTLGGNIDGIAKRRSSESQSLPRLVRGDIDWIVMKAMEKDRTRRYETANGLAMDIKRHLASEPVLASPPSRFYRLRKLVHRNRAAFVSTLVVFIGLLAALSIASFAFLHANQERQRAEAAEEKARLLRHLFGGGQVSLAVLPLENRSADPEHEYLADGLTTSLIGELSRISALRVLSDQSVRSALRHVGSQTSLREIATELKVDGVVKGWVERRGDGVRLTLQLVHALTNQNLSQLDYEDQFRNMQAIEHAVSRDIAAELQLDLTPEERARLASAKVIDPEAQVAYLKGHHVMKGMTRQTLLRALAFFDRAIEIEPEYAAAHAGRAKVFSLMENQFAAPMEAMPQAKQAALRAIELDPTLAEAHEAVADVKLFFDWDWDGAEQAYLKAIELDPDYPDAYVGYAMFLAAMARFDEAVEQLDLALAVDPVVIVSTGDAFLITSFFTRRYDRCVEHCMAAIEMDPQLWFPHVWLALALVELEQYDAAIAAAEEGRRIAVERWEHNDDDTPAPLVYGVLGQIYGWAAQVEDDPQRAASLTEKAREALKEIDRLGELRFACPYETAVVHVALREWEQAFEMFREAIRTRSPCIPALGIDPRIDPIRPYPLFEEIWRSDERVADLMRRVGQQPPPPSSYPKVEGQRGLHPRKATRKQDPPA